MDYKIIDGVEIEKFRAMPHHIVVRWLGKPETNGGILIPENRQRKMYMNGLVLKSAASKEDIKVGDRIVFDSMCDKEFLGPECPGDRDPVFMMREEDVFCIDDRAHDADGKIVDEPMPESSVA